MSSKDEVKGRDLELATKRTPGEAKQKEKTEEKKADPLATKFHLLETELKSWIGSTKNTDQSERVHKYAQALYREMQNAKIKSAQTREEMLKAVQTDEKIRTLLPHQQKAFMLFQENPILGLDAFYRDCLLMQKSLYSYLYSMDRFTGNPEDKDATNRLFNTLYNYTRAYSAIRPKPGSSKTYTTLEEIAEERLFQTGIERLLKAGVLTIDAEEKMPASDTPKPSSRGGHG